ncbi:MAG: hypothetical protein ACRD0Q_01210 [Acidimicrobiales bacterium]
MGLWWLPIILVGVVGSVFLGVAFVRLDKALRAVRRGLDELAEAVPATEQVKADLDAWRAAVSRTRQN